MSYQFIIPPDLQSAFELGKIVRRGALLINADGGGIVAHLQETGAISALASTLSGVANPVAAVGNLVTGAVQVFQNEQIKSRIDLLQSSLGALQSLQVAALATSVFGLGVSIAGTMLICKRLDGLAAQSAAMRDEVAGLRGLLHADRMEESLVDVKTHVERIDSATARANPGPVLQAAEQALHEANGIFDHAFRKLAAGETIPTHALGVVLHGLTLTATVRIKSLFLMDEVQIARDAAERQLRNLGELTILLPQDLLARKIVGVDDGAMVASNLSKDLAEARDRLAGIPSLLDRLHSTGLRPSAYLAAAEREKDAPIMFLLPDKT